MRVAVGSLPGVPLRMALGVPLQDTDLAQSVFGMAGKSTLSARTAGSAPRAAALQGPGVAAEHLQQVPSSRPILPPPDFNTASYDRIDDNRFRRVADEPVSTFSTDVDTASYSNVRRYLNDGQLPPADAVRVEELVNYFHFPYADPGGTCPSTLRLRSPRVRGTRGTSWRSSACRRGATMRSTRPPRNLVFLLDVSGSMMPSGRLPLVKTAMRMLVGYAHRARSRRHRGLRRCERACAALDAGGPQGGHPPCARQSGGRGLHQWRRRHPARVRHGRGSL